jgi:uncharacterized protein (DUF2384 family)
MHQHDRAELIALAYRIFGDQLKADEWLDRPSLQLGGRTPRELLASVEGGRRVEELLAQIDDHDRLDPRQPYGGRTS